MDQVVIRYPSYWKIGTDSRPLAVGFMVDKMTLRQFFLQVL